jgi:integrase
MRGTIISRTTRKGKKSWGFSFFAGRDENGKRIQKVKRGFDKKGDAEEALREAIEEHQQAPAAERDMPTFAAHFERWHGDHVKRHCSPKTAERYYELGQVAIRLFGNMPLDELDTMKLESAVNHLSDHGGRPTEEHPKGRPLSAKTVRHIAFMVHSCLQKAIKWKLISANPMEDVDKPALVRRRPKVLDRQGLDALFRRAAGTRLFPLIVMAASTGMRRGELLALEWTDINWDRREVEVSKSLEQTKAGLRVKGTKSEKPRRFSLPDETIAVLRDHQRAQDADRDLYGRDYAKLDLIFARPDGYYYSPDRVGARVREYMISAGLTGVSLHSLRHSHASELLSQGAPITAVAERLGHASPNITLGIYGHALPADMDNQAAAVLWNDALAGVVAESRKAALKKRMLSNVIKGTGKAEVIPIKSAS